MNSLSNYLKGLFLSFLFLFFSSFINLNTIFASEQINFFYSTIEINQNTSLTITEQIDYITTDFRHGIYRYIPVSYNKDGQKEVLLISDISVSDGQGVSIPFSQSFNGRFLTLKIGDADITFTGEKKYVINYAVERGINQFEDHNELYWDITGEGWQIPITQSSATVISKFAPINQAECFSGPFGFDDGLCEFEAGSRQATFSYSDTINYGDNMTVVLSFPKESDLIFPTQSELFFLWIKYNWPLLFLPIPILIMFFWWYFKGRDFEFISQNVFDLDDSKPFRLKPIGFGAREPMVYEPLKGLTPGESGSLLDEKIDIQDIVAEILELARKKYLKIEVSEKKVLFTTTRDYEFTKLKEASNNDVAKGTSINASSDASNDTSNNAHADLTDVQSYLFSEIFKTGDNVKLSKLKGKFYTAIATAKSKLESALVAKKVYRIKPTTARVTGIVGLLVLEGGMYGLLSLTLLPLGIYWPIGIIVLETIFGFWFAYNLPQKTAVGNNLWLQARGLRASINRGAWREKIKEKNLFIEEVLPFAVSLGVVKQLAKDMKELKLEPPSYIVGSGLTTWSTADFVSSFSSEVGNSLSYNPSSSSSSGGSGFSGGSSGGGGGGGGGGSW